VQLQGINTHRQGSTKRQLENGMEGDVGLQQQSNANVSILIVEDNRAASKLIGRMVALNFPDAVVYSADNGLTGVELFIKHDPDIVLTDISMPEMNGFAMVNEIQSIRPDTKFIVFTAHSEGEFLPRFKAIGVDKYLLKPLSLDELMMAIDGCTYEEEHL